MLCWQLLHDIGDTRRNEFFNPVVALFEQPICCLCGGDEVDEGLEERGGARGTDSGVEVRGTCVAKK